MQKKKSSNPMKRYRQKNNHKKKYFEKTIIFSLACAPLLTIANPYTTMLPHPLFFVETPKLPTPRISLIGAYGNYGIGQVDLFTPFWRNDAGIFFFDLRATATAQSTQIYNGALGFRAITGNTHKAIIGAHLWEDRKHTQYGNFFNQGTLGLEYFGPIYSITSNIYVPYGERKQIAYETDITPFATGHTVGYFANADYEMALHGVDIEIGKQNLINRHLRVYGDYYHFGEGSDDLHMNGGRVRSEYIIENKWLHQMGSDVMLTAALQYDNIQHAAGFLGVRLNIGKDYEPTDALVGRLEEYIIRDNDVITPLSSSTALSVTDPNTFIFVDNTKPAGGNGTREHPYNNEEEAIANSERGNIIYTFQGAGNYPLPSGGLNLKENQIFFGSGSDYIFNNIVILPATSAPTLNGRINVTNNDTINGFTLTGQGSNENIAIYGNNVSHISILNTTIQDFTGTDANGTNGIVTGGNGGSAGNAYGVQIRNSTDIYLNHVTVNNILGGDANGGTANSSGEFAYGGDGGVGGNAIGIDLAGSSTITLNHLIVNNVSGGDANGGIATGTYLGTAAYGGDGGIGGRATAIDLTGASLLIFSHVSITGITGGSANGGDANTSPPLYSDGSYGGNGGTGGDAIGIKGLSSIPTTVTITSITGGTATAGNATGSIANTPGIAGIDGTASAVQP